MLYFYGGKEKNSTFFSPQNGNKAEKPIVQAFRIWQISRKTGGRKFYQFFLGL